MDAGSKPWVSQPVAQDVLRLLQIAYPIILLSLYIVAFTIRSVATAAPNDNNVSATPEQLGPGGKPLPKKNQNQVQKELDIPYGLDFSRPRKLLFEWLSVAVIASVGANVVVVIVHALLQRGWWCGQAPTVSLGVPISLLPPSPANGSDLLGGLVHGLHSPPHSYGRLKAITDHCSFCIMGRRSDYGDHPPGSFFRFVHYRASGKQGGTSTRRRTATRHDRVLPSSGYCF